jgi:GDPmannose 4,6-dehydratase
MKIYHSAITALILGISGQDGSLLAKLLLSKGYIVHGTSRDAELTSLYRLQLLGIEDMVTLHSVSINDFASILSIVESVRPFEIYNLAGQTSVSLSYSQPVQTLDSIANSAFNLLEVMRLIDFPCKYYNACSSECFGDTGGNKADELTPFKPLSPYGIAKLASFHQTANYRSSYNLFACSGILFNHESTLRATRFVTRKVTLAAARIALGSNEKLSLGDLSIQRDWGWAPEYVDAMWRMLQLDEPHDFVICTGHSYSLLQFVETVFSYHNLKLSEHLVLDQSLIRPTEIAFSGGNPTKSRNILGWRPELSMFELAIKMAHHDYQLVKDSI